MPLAGPRVEEVLNVVYLRISDRGKVRLLRKEATDETIEILIGATLLRTVRMRKVAAYVEFFFDLRISKILRTAITREGLAEIRRHGAQSFEHHSIRLCDSAITHLADEDDSRYSLVDRLEPSDTFPRHHRVVLPMTDLDTSVDDNWTIVYRRKRRMFRFLRLSEAFLLSPCVTTRQVRPQVFASFLHLSVSPTIHSSVHFLVHGFNTLTHFSIPQTESPIVTFLFFCLFYFSRLRVYLH